MPTAPNRRPAARAGLLALPRLPSFAEVLAPRGASLLTLETAMPNGAPEIIMKLRRLRDAFFSAPLENLDLV